MAIVNDAVEAEHIADLLGDISNYITRRVLSDAEDHYNQFIFAPRFPHDSPELQYEEIYGKEEVDLIERITNLLWKL